MDTIWRQGICCWLAGRAWLEVTSWSCLAGWLELAGWNWLAGYGWLELSDWRWLSGTDPKVWHASAFLAPQRKTLKAHYDEDDPRYFLSSRFRATVIYRHT